MNEQYKPGTHQLLTLQVNDVDLLTNMSIFLDFTIHQINDHGLKIVGISSHEFDSKGFTVAICLMESHICIHTWPEFSQLTLDIYLCNYLKDNTHKVLELGEIFKHYFDALVLNETIVNR